MNWPTASAKLMVVIPSPVELLSGETNKPSDWRAPIVTIRMPAADNVTTTADLFQVLIRLPFPSLARRALLRS
jgi:hypothetical protein